MNAFISVAGIYNLDPSIFDGLVIPQQLDRDTLIANILVETMELETLYPHADILRSTIAMWSKIKLPYWEKLETTLHLEYNPIHNYDRTEEWTDEDSGESSSSGESSGESGSNTINSREGGATEKATAFNSDLQKITGSTEDSAEENSETTATDKTSTNSSGEYKKTLKRTGRASGNIGVTTTQEMIRQEREIADFDLYSVITEEFKRRFCLLVY